MSAVDTSLLARPINAENAQRLQRYLKRCIEDGVDLGPRGHQIRSISASLEAALPELLAALGDLRSYLDAAALDDFVHGTGIDSLVQTAGALISATRNFPVE